MERMPAPFYRDEEALRGLVALCGQDLYGRALLRTGDERIARALSRRVILRLAELDRDTPLRFCRLLADAYLEQTLSEWELAMLQNSIRGGWIGGPAPERTPAAPGNGPSCAAGSEEAEPARGETIRGARADEADGVSLADETPFPSQRKKRSAPQPPPEPALPEENEEEEGLPESGGAPVWLILLLSVLCLLLLWFALGLFMRMGALPFLDLGYRFFNAHVLPLF